MGVVIDSLNWLGTIPVLSLNLLCDLVAQWGECDNFEWNWNCCCQSKERNYIWKKISVFSFLLVYIKDIEDMEQWEILNSFLGLFILLSIFFPMFVK